ncbi:hypothetical protein BH09VER1_BH09VER1_42570 [soil metagenome]
MLRILLALLLTLQLAGAVDLSPLEQLPVRDADGGRKKPYFVFAEESLLAVSGKTAFKVDEKHLSAMEAVTTLWLAPAGWEKKPIIFVNSQPLKAALSLDPKKSYFSYAELFENKALISLLNEAEVARAQPGNQKLTGLPKDASTVGLRMAEFEALATGTAFRIAAAPEGTAPWTPAPEPLLDPLRAAFAANDSAAFTQAAVALRQAMAATQPQFQPVAWKIQLETLYQKFHPFRWAWICYLAAGIVLVATRGRRAGYVVAWALAVAGFLCQIEGFVARMIIAGRPPVTNMYESIVWVAFGCILFALLFEAIYRSRYFLLGAIPVAVLSLFLADTQPLALNRAIDPLTPVLRDNYWLTIHVLTITLSYAAFAVALGMGHIALVSAMRGKKPTVVYNCIYRVLQVGVLLLAIGTILGGVWANYSWGRFWDWDPKETWALTTLIGYLFLLHGRIAGRWGGFGLAVGSVLGFLSVVMAWYGVNFVLGVGLHSYGFGTGGFGWAVAYVAIELAFVALAIVKTRGQREAAERISSSEEQPEFVS